MYVFSTVVIYFLCFYAVRGRGDIEISDKDKIRGMVIKYIHIKSDIKYRFAATSINTLLHNHDNVHQEAVFHVRLPKNAFTTNFTMLIDDVEYPGKIEEKHKAREEYQTAQQRGETAGYVGTSPRNSNDFKVSVNIAGQSNASFQLIYNELLERRLGLYEHVIYVDPGQIIDDFRIDVFIKEQRPIKTLNIPAIRNDTLTDFEIIEENKHARIVSRTETSVHISFAPTPAQQREYFKHGVSGQFIVNYDVDRLSDIGEILTINGYFVHYFAPKNLTALPKSVMFVLDVSGSMSGRKIAQMKTALNIILQDLRPEDEFNIISFSNYFQIWKESMVKASKTNTLQAIRYADSMVARGGTNINLALKKALQFRPFISSRKHPIIFFLTDGQATTGVTQSTTILINIEQTNAECHSGKVSIYSLAFGNRADYNLLRSMSDMNNGVARKIFEDSDASLQVAGFYAEIGEPLMANVDIEYLEEISKGTLTDHTFRTYFEGSELVVIGKMGDRGLLPPRPLARGDESQKSISPDNRYRKRLDLYDAINLTENNNTETMNDRKYKPTFTVCVFGETTQGKVKFNVTVEVIEPEPWMVRIYDGQPDDDINPYTEVIRRMWAYKTLKQLLKKKDLETNLTIKQKLVDRALNLSLKYNFVTPLTSMVVTKPEEIVVIDGESEISPSHDSLTLASARSRTSLKSPSISRPFRLGVAFPQSHPGPPGIFGSPYFSLGSNPMSFSHRLPYRGKPRRLPPSGLAASSRYASLHTAPMRKKKVKNSKVPKTGTKMPSILKVDLTTTISICLPLPKVISKPPWIQVLQTNKSELSGEMRKASTSGAGYNTIVFNAVSFKTANTTIMISSENVVLNNKVYYWWSDLNIRTIDHIEVKKYKTLSVNIETSDKVKFTVEKIGMQTRRSRAKPFLRIEVKAVGDGTTNNKEGFIVDVLKNVEKVLGPYTRYATLPLSTARKIISKLYKVC